MRAAVIYNPTSGRDRGETIASQVEERLRYRGMDVDLYGTQAPEDASRLARAAAEAADVLVAVGGDGTMNEVANGLMDWAAEQRTRGVEVRPRLGIVPAGTVNVLALDLGIPFNTDKACEVIAAGKTTFLDVGKANGRSFVLMVGAGIDALTIRNLDPVAKKRFRELAFLGTGLKTGLAAPPSEFIVRVGDEEHRATFVVAGNTHYYGGRFGVTPRADPSDGLLDLMIFTGTNRPSLAVFWLGVPSNLHLYSHNVRYLKAERAEIRPLDPEQVIWFQTDGELAGTLPVLVEIEPQALEVLVP